MSQSAVIMKRKGDREKRCVAILTKRLQAGFHIRVALYRLKVVIMLTVAEFNYNRTSYLSETNNMSETGNSPV